MSARIGDPLPGCYRPPPEATVGDGEATGAAWDAAPRGGTGAAGVDAAARLDEAKVATTLELLLRVARRVDEEARARIDAEAGRVVARRATLELLPHVDLAGTRVTELAERLGISKQAVSKRVGELVDEGVLELRPDPADGRARRVAFTARGLDAIHHGLGVLRALESELRRDAGDDAVDALRDALRRLVAVLPERR